MMRAFTVSGFKRFEHQRFDLAALTVLAGLNGTGKSSAIHALLLAREALVIGSVARSVRLNGPFGLELGTAEDVRNWTSAGEITFEAEHASDRSARWRFSAPFNDALYLLVEDRPDAPPVAFTAEPRVFTYLCAERLGPRSVLGASALPTELLEVGVQGEYCAHVLALLGDRPISDQARRHPDTAPDAAFLLKYQMEQWLRDIVRPIEVDTERYPGTAVTAFRFRTPGGDWVRAPNMGFGVSYALPVVLAGLIAAQGGLLIIENPEAHLHPAGQSRMGVFIAWLAARGVQVVVETHSDHVLNGIRRAIGEYRYLANTDAIVHYFDSVGDTAQVTPLHFTPTGGVSSWPPGFFDQYQVDVAALGRVRRRT